MFPILYNLTLAQQRTYTTILRQVARNKRTTRKLAWLLASEESRVQITMQYHDN
jgi:hypothetical protein